MPRRQEAGEPMGEWAGALPVVQGRELRRWATAADRGAGRWAVGRTTACR